MRIFVEGIEKDPGLQAVNAVRTIRLLTSKTLVYRQIKDSISLLYDPKFRTVDSVMAWGEDQLFSVTSVCRFFLYIKAIAVHLSG